MPGEGCETAKKICQLRLRVSMRGPLLVLSTVAVGFLFEPCQWRPIRS